MMSDFDLEEQREQGAARTTRYQASLLRFRPYDEHEAALLGAMQWRSRPAPRELPPSNHDRRRTTRQPVSRLSRRQSFTSHSSDGRARTGAAETAYLPHLGHRA